MNKKTILNTEHKVLHARMTDFGGWEMPIHYGSQIEEHHAVRQNAGVFDISHMLPVEITGPQARQFLLRLVANDVSKLQSPGKALYTCMLNEQGGTVDDLIIYFMSETCFRLIVNAGTATKDMAWIHQCQKKWGMDIEVKPLREETYDENDPKGLAMLAIQGPHAEHKLSQTLPELEQLISALPSFSAQIADTSMGQLFIARTGYTGEDGFEVMLSAKNAATFWQALLAHGVKPCGLGARDTLRLEAGMPLYGQEMDEHTSPLDAGLAWTIALDDKRDFTGKAALQKNGPQHKLVGLILEGNGILRAGQRVHVSDQHEGIITSGTFSPTMECSIAMARLPLIELPNTAEVEIRNKRLTARITKPRFVRHGKIIAE